MSKQKDMKSFYDQWSKNFEWLELNYLHPIFLNWAIKPILLRNDDKVLDIGCGTGWFTRKIAKQIPKGEVIGIDVSTELLKLAKQLTLKDKKSRHNNLKFRNAIAENIPFPENYFDCALSTVSFSWWEHPLEGLKEIHRVLKPNGRLHIIDVCKDIKLMNFVMKIVNLFMEYKEKVYSMEQYKIFFRKAGFKKFYQLKKMAMLFTIGLK